MKELLKGNVAIAEAAIRAGCEAYFGYPITPQTELLEHMAKHMPELGRVVGVDKQDMHRLPSAQ